MSTASRAIKSRMISDEPSKMRDTRKSRSICSAGSGLVAATAPDLDHLVGHEPGHLRAPEFCDGRLDANVVPLLVGQRARQLDDRLHRIGGGGDESQLLRNGVMLADRPPPLHPLS